MEYGYGMCYIWSTMNFLKGIFADQHTRAVRSYYKIVDQINALEPAISALSDDELRAKTPALKQMLADGKTLSDILP